jgi:hypothetical protein
LSKPKFTVPKLASGKTPRDDDGASAIHSAEDLAAFETVPVVVKDLPVLPSVMVTVNVLLCLPKEPLPELPELPEYVTLAEIASPGSIDSEVIWYIGLG